MHRLVGVDPDEFSQLLRRLIRETDLMPSSTLVNDQFAIRQRFIDVRTTAAHVEALMDAVLRIGRELALGSK